MNQLILASGSPRRRELLGLFGIPFAVHAADIDETMDPDKSPKDEVARVSRCKAAAIRREEGDAVIAADTIVARARCWASPTAASRQLICSGCCLAGSIR